MNPLQLVDERTTVVPMHTGIEIIERDTQVVFDGTVFGGDGGTGRVVGRAFFGEAVTNYNVRVDGMEPWGGMGGDGQAVVPTHMIRKAS